MIPRGRDTTARLPRRHLFRLLIGLLAGRWAGDTLAGQAIGSGADGTAQGASRGRAAAGADQLFWVPTLEQAEAMARANGMPIFIMGYSLVDSRSTYTRIADDYCSAVF